jgi:hypothetical protein
MSVQEPDSAHHSFSTDIKELEKTGRAYCTGLYSLSFNHPAARIKSGNCTFSNVALSKKLTSRAEYEMGGLEMVVAERKTSREMIKVQHSAKWWSTEHALRFAKVHRDRS